MDDQIYLVKTSDDVESVEWKRHTDQIRTYHEEAIPSVASKECSEEQLPDDIGSSQQWPIVCKLNLKQ